MLGPDHGESLGSLTVSSGPNHVSRGRVGGGGLPGADDTILNEVRDVQAVCPAGKVPLLVVMVPDSSVLFDRVVVCVNAGDRDVVGDGLLLVI